ncbi:DNA polymerase III subunit gamma and tau [Desertivibrio insolitus]|uniref:DNA polymerase III subunit gamma and tau n=1 Tax=Herbiconiux sp. SYSU D00978 TaxID=2812562 RepID=UPI001A96A8B9|nr:DNA polymerase III subunit gamma and tau [Herbiconiux sp. SYSU D00978]
MVTALYRRYRPETFSELIGQSQVTDPLRTALKSDRVNHAYLFSGPRGCGKTTSARILARCLNCAEGPTDTPCGTCPSCVELSRAGGGSLDVVEIDAASHNGVDDARDLRERAVFAPARDRYKIFILDEAHMVTPQGFNALLKIVEEPPEHVKFIFATTEPEKVIGTIRSRTHHYPFRLVPPAQMLAYTQELCDSEGITVDAGVLPLVVRAGGGSVRDTLSLLDQLIAGSEGTTVSYERAVALLGYTHGALLDEVVDALGSRDAAGVFGAVDRVIQTGQDPRRFVEDLLERLRDLIIVAATGSSAASVLRGIPQDELDRMQTQAANFGSAELSRAADVANTALTEMTGATSPRLHLELMVARMLVPASDETERGALARVERLERRVGVEGVGGAPSGAASLGGATSAPGGRVAGDAPSGGRAAGDAGVSRPGTPATSRPAATAPFPTAPSEPGIPGAPEPSYPGPSEPSPFPAPDPIPAPQPMPTPAEPNPTPPGRDPIPEPETEPAPSGAHRTDQGVAPEVQATPQARPTDLRVGDVPAGAPVTLQQMKDSWPQVLESIERARRTAWLVAVTATVRDLKEDVLTLTFPSDRDVEEFKKPQGAGESVSEYVRRAIIEVLGLRVRFIARADGPGARAPQQGAPAQTRPAVDRPAAPERAAAPAADRAPAAPASSGGRASGDAASSGGRVAGDAGASRPGTSHGSRSGTRGPQQRTQSRPVDDVPPPTDDDAPPTDDDWAVVAIPGADEPVPAAPEFAAPTTVAAPPVAARPQASAPAVESRAAAAERTAPPQERPARPAMERNRYGEAVVREILSANFIEEQRLTPSVVPSPAAE